MLLDINLPDLSGDIVAKKILAMNTSANIILITAEDRNEESDDGGHSTGCFRLHTKARETEHAARYSRRPLISQKANRYQRYQGELFFEGLWLSQVEHWSSMRLRKKVTGTGETFKHSGCKVIQWSGVRIPRGPHL